MVVQNRNLGASDQSFSRRQDITVRRNSQASQFASDAGAALLPFYSPLHYNTTNDNWELWQDGDQLDSVVMQAEGVQLSAAGEVLYPVMLEGEIEADKILLPSGQTQGTLDAAKLALQERRIGIVVRGLATGP